MLFKKTHRTQPHKTQDFSRISDEELLQAISPETFAEVIDEIFRRYSYLLYGLCNKYLHNSEDSKDAVQSIFEKIIEDSSTQNIRNLKAWLIVVAKNHCLMHLRKKRLDSKELTPENTSGALQRLFDDEMAQKATEEETDEQISATLGLLEQLATPQNICVTLMYIEDKSYKEIAEITGFEMNEVKSHIQNGKRNLRKLFADKYGK